MRVDLRSMHLRMRGFESFQALKRWAWLCLFAVISPKGMAQDLGMVRVGVWDVNEDLRASWSGAWEWRGRVQGGSDSLQMGQDIVPLKNPGSSVRRGDLQMTFNPQGFELQMPPNQKWELHLYDPSGKQVQRGMGQANSEGKATWIWNGVLGSGVYALEINWNEQLWRVLLSR